MHISILARSLVLCLSALALSSCETSTAPGAIGADRKQLLLVSSAEMNRMAVEGYNEMKAGATKEDILNKDDALLQRVRGGGCTPPATDPGIPYRRAGLELGSQRT